MIFYISLLLPKSLCPQPKITVGHAFWASPLQLCTFPHGTNLPLRKFASLFVTCIVTISFLMVSVISSCQRDCAFDYLCLSGLRQPGELLSSATS